MKIYKLSLVIPIIIILSCSRGTMNFFFDGADQKTGAESENQKGSSGILLNESLSDTTQQRGTNHIAEMISFHPDYREKKCEKCHDVNHAYRLINRQPELCYNCHKSFEEVYEVLHGPVAAGFCTTCHKPHQSEHDKLLILPVREVCRYCHQPGDVNKNEAHQKVASDNCMTCHNSHGGKTLNLLRE